MPVVERVDFAPSRLGKFTRLAAGGVRVPATIARTGCQRYGDIVEYRPDSEVFAPASLETLPAAPVTRGHPAEQVSPANWRSLAVGHVSEIPPERKRIDANDWIETSVVLSDAAAQAAVERGDLLEVSAGYTCELDPTPGVAPDGTRYDAVQRNIRWNHLAVLGPGERARAGEQARLRLDQERDHMVKIVIDGVEYEKGSDAHIAAVQAADKRKHDAELAQRDISLVSEKARADKAEGERDVARAELEKAKAACAPEKLDALVTEALKLRADAARLLPGDYKFDGKSSHKIRCDAVKDAGLTIEGRSETYISASFDTLLAKAPAAGSAQYTGVVPGTRTTSDATETKTDAEVYAAHEARMRKVYTDSFGKDAN